MRITVKGIEVDYTTQGTGEPVLILPGWSATAPAYQTVTATLAQKFGRALVCG